MKLRWLVINYPQPTVEQVKQLRAETGEGMMYCKKILTKPSEKKLQYCVNEYSEDWEDIPTVVWNV